MSLGYTYYEEVWVQTTGIFYILRKRDFHVL